MERFDELYYKKPYIKEFDAVVTGCRELTEKEQKAWMPEASQEKLWAITLDQTAFYPEGGGQPGDRGQLLLEDGQEIRILDSRKPEDDVFHIADAPLAEGTKVCGKLDWQRRKDHMEAHSGEHIVSGLIFQNYGLENIGFHMGEEFVTIDFSGPLTWEQVSHIESLANAVIREDIPVVETMPDGAELSHIEYRSKKELSGIVRIVTVPGADVCACCGTHVMRTGEVGLVKIASLLNRKKGARLEMLAGRKALEYWQRELAQVTEVCQLLSLQPQELFEGVKRLEEERDAIRFKLNGAVQRILAMEADELIAKEEPKALLIHFTEGAGLDQLRFLCNKLMDSGRFESAAALSEDENGRTNYIIMSRSLDLKPLAKPLNERLSGRGGGSKDMIQGSYLASRDAIKEALTEILLAEQ